MPGSIRASLIAVTVGLSALASPHIYAQSSIRIDGADAGYALSKSAVEEFQKAKKDAAPKFVLGTSGSAGGLRKLCKGELELANTARPILKEEAATCQKAGVEFIELPVALDAITVVVNPRNRFVSSLTLEELKRMWQAEAQGKVVRWSQVNARFPDAPLKLLAPDYQFEVVGTFTEAVLGHGAKPRGDTMSSVDDNVLIQGVARDVNVLSYVPYATYLDHRTKLRAVPIAAEEGTAPVIPSAESVANGTYRLLARPLFLYVNAKALERPAVREFVEFALANGSQFARTAHYLPLADATYRLDVDHLRNSSRGTAWGGTVPLGLTLEELQKRQAAL
jgi:phosphate transport system substrate-binding protein